MKPKIFFGKICCGKSTYLQKHHPGYVDFDKFIWTFIPEWAKWALKNGFKRAILENERTWYTDLMLTLNDMIHWQSLFDMAREKSNVFEISALGRWWHHIPKDILAEYEIVRVYCSDDIRAERAKKRGCIEMMLAMDQFYLNPPSWHTEVCTE